MPFPNKFARGAEDQSSIGLGRTVRDTGWALAASALSKLKGVLLLATLTRFLGFRDYGLWIQLQVLVNIVTILGGLGLFQGLVQFLPERSDPHGQRALVWNITTLTSATGLALTLLALTISQPISHFFKLGSQGSTLITLASLTGAFSGIRLMQLNYFRGHNYLKAFSVGSSVVEVADLGVITLLAIGSRSLSLVMAGSALVQLFSSLALAWYLFRRVGPPTKFHETREVLRYSLPLIPSQLADEVLARGDRVIVGSILGAGAAGLYSAVYALVSLPQLLNSALTAVQLPKMTGGRFLLRGVRRIWRRSILVYAVAAIAWLALLAPLGSEAIKLITGRVPRPAGLTWLFLFTGLGVSAFGAGRLVSLNLFAARKTRLVALIWVAAAAVNVGMNLLFVPRLGILGAGLSTIVAYGLFLIVLITFVTVSDRKLLTSIDRGPAA